MVLHTCRSSDQRSECRGFDCWYEAQEARFLTLLRLDSAPTRISWTLDRSLTPGVVEIGDGAVVGITQYGRWNSGLALILLLL